MISIMQKPFGKNEALRPHRRSGATYVFVLSTALLVTVIGLSALLAVRIQLRSARSASDIMAARFYAQSAIELGMEIIRQEPTWRSTRGTATWLDKIPFGTGELTLNAVIDTSDGDGFAENDSVVLKGTGTNGVARHTMQVKLIALSNAGGMVIESGSWQRD